MLSFMGTKGYANGIGMMSAEERTAAGEKGFANGIGADRSDVSRRRWQRVKRKGFAKGIRAMSAEERTAAYFKGIGASRARRERQRVKRDF